jgi:acyl carrier protein
MNDPTEFEQVLRNTIAEFCLVRPEALEASHRLQDDLGFDSITSMELLSLLSERSGIEVSIEEAMQITTVGELLALGLERSRNARAST